MIQEWPIYKGGLTDDAGLRKIAPSAGIKAVHGVIAHDHVVLGTHLERCAFVGEQARQATALVLIRDEFIDEHYSEIYVEVFNLCAKHHQALHRIFGKAPALSTAAKQNRWIEKQKAKALGIEAADQDKPKGTFSAFY